MDMDMDVFIQYLNDTKQSAIRGVRHFNLNLSDHKIRKLIKSNGYKYINQKWIKENSLHTISRNFTLDEQEEDVDLNVLEESVHVTSHDVISRNFTLNEIDSHDMNSHNFTLDEQEEGVDMNLLEKQQENVIEDKLHTNSHQVNSPPFTSDEITSLRAMIDDWEQVKPTIQLATENDLISRIEAMPKDEKVRKTIVISKSTGEQLDEFCKVNRVQKSTILELAINDFILRY